MQKNTKKKIPPVIITILVILYILPPVCVIIYAAGIAASEDFTAFLPFLLLYAVIGGAVIIGIIHALSQRLREIDGGEEDEASKY